MDNTQAIKAYNEVAEVIDKYPEVFKNDYDISKVKSQLRRLEMEQRFGIPLEECGGSYRVKSSYDDWTRVVCSPSISWSDDNQQPEEDEWLYRICFPTGPYIFGDYMKDQYPRETFNAFFAELKSFGTKYCDTVNNCLYFSEENSKEVYEAFWDIFKKYKSMVGEEMKRQRKQELEEELAKLNEVQS